MNVDFSQQIRRFFAVILSDCKKKATQYAGKKTVQAAGCACGYNFL